MNEDRIRIGMGGDMGIMLMFTWEERLANTEDQLKKFAHAKLEALFDKCRGQIK